MKVANSIEELIGRTPVIQLGKMADPKGARVLVKLEFFNPAGSIKDRFWHFSSFSGVGDHDSAYNCEHL
jgi:threonine dehydratase